MRYIIEKYINFPRCIITEKNCVSLFFFLLVVQSISCLYDIFRTLAIYNTAHIAQATTLLVDLLFVMLMVCSRRIFSLPKVIVPVISICGFSFLIGLLNYNYTYSLVTDLLLYTSFLLKIIIFYSLLKEDVYQHMLRKFLKVYSTANIVFAVIGIAILSFLYFIGYRFYFALEPDITYAAGLTLVSGKYMLAYFIALLSVLTGKRMLVAGVLVIFMLGFFRFLNRKKHYRLMLPMLIIAVFIGILGKDYSFQGLNKIHYVVRQLSSVEKNENENILVSVFKKADMARYVESTTILDKMGNSDFLFGKGYGFRYIVKHDYLPEKLEVDSANAHFSPLGVFSKFGVVGFLVWYGFLLYILMLSFKLRGCSYIHYCNFLYISSILVQSLFAYILFWQPLLPIIIAFTLSEAHKKRSVLLDPA